MKSLKALILLALVGMVACKNEPQEPAIVPQLGVNYYIRADETEMVKAEALVKYNNDTLLPPIESIVFHGAKMKESQSTEKVRRFVLTENFKHETKFDFTFMTTEGLSAKNEFVIQPIKSFKIVEGKMSKTNGFHLEWEGEPTTPSSETLVLMITDAQGQTLSLNRIGETAESGFFVAAPQLSFFASGPAEIYLVRKTHLELPAEEKYEVTANLEYYTPPFKTIIEE